ncbi:MAG: response regulator transcription factor [Coriobacteriales bacterium]|jgi:DNA-binding response OmpR family regulator|nr:response regulator transcription factor [Coriobacteriales bacterium]
MGRMKLLYVEDHKDLARALAQVLRKNNYSVDLAFDGENGLLSALSDAYDLIVLDIMLPKMDGISVLKRLREDGIQTPVILLTARGDPTEIVRGLDAGADDYLAKPFRADELLARLRALGRRRGQFAPDNTLSFGDIELNYNTLDLSGTDQTFHLTLKESQLLELLLRNRGQAIPSTTIIEKLWGWDSKAEDSHVQVQVAFVRRKLALLSKQVRIKTIRGVGYLLALEEGD